MFANYDAIKSDLVQVALPFIGELTEKRKRELVGAVFAAFETFKASKTDDDGNIEIRNVFAGGLLGELATPIRTVSASELEAWQCAGPGVTDDITLAYHLWLANDPEFTAVTLRFGLDTTFAAIMVWSLKEATIESLARVGGMLAHFAHGDAKFWKEEHRQVVKRSGDLSGGPKAATIQRQKEAQEREEKAHIAFAPLFRENQKIAIKQAAKRAEEMLADPTHPLHGEYKYSTLRDDVLPKVKKAVALEQLRREL